MPINTERILKELSKGEVGEQVAAYKVIKEYVALNVKQEQELTEMKANELQQTYDRINNLG